MLHTRLLLQQNQNLLKTAKDNVDAYFINSGTATCENMQAIYGPKVAENKSNLDYLKQVISVMQILKCTNEEAYFEASEAAHAIEPTAATALGCGYMYYKKVILIRASATSTKQLNWNRIQWKKLKTATKQPLLS